jgi:hypothetical protein
MGLFFSSAKTLKLSEIEKIVKEISSLDYKEKERVIGAFATVAQNNITKEEFRKVIHELYESHKIGEFDYKNLKTVWEEKY